MKKIFNILCVGLVCCSATTLFTSCDDFLNEHKPQATLSDEQVKSPENAEAMAISAYAIFTSAEDINSSFSMWNFDVRSDDAYKGGNGTSDGDVFHQLEIQQGVLTTNWNINDMWVRLYNSLSRVNSAIALLKETDDSYAMKGQRLAEMKFLRAYGHFLLKRLYKNIPFVVNENLTYEEYNELSNTQYTNDEGWQLIIDDLMEAYNTLPEVQQDKGRPTRAAAAAFLAKVYLYKAYRQDDAKSNQVTSINQDDLQKVIEFTNPALYANYGLEDDIHNNFRPEEEYENGIESIWAIQYSRNDGSTYGNLNWSYGLIPPNIPGATDGGCDFYKPSQNLVNAYHTGADGLPLLDNFNEKDFNLAEDNADPRLFLTVGMPGLPYMFNRNYMMEETSIWSRSNGLYGYYVSLKHNVDPALIGSYLIKGSYWASSMNRIVFRYADVLLMRAECKVRLGKDGSADFNAVRNRAGASPRECTLDNIFDERLLELCWEGWRRPDMIRFHRYKSLYEGPDAIDESDGHTTVFPIPAEVRALNQNLTQNPGY